MAVRTHWDWPYGDSTGSKNILFECKFREFYIRHDLLVKQAAGDAANRRFSLSGGGYQERP